MACENKCEPVGLVIRTANREIGQLLVRMRLQLRRKTIYIREEMTKLIGHFAIIVGASLVAGCASTASNYQATTTAVSEPPLNSVNEKQLGDELLTQGKYREHDAIHLTSTVQASWGFKIHPGYFLKIGEDSSGEYYRTGGSGDESGYVTQPSGTSRAESVMYKKSTRSLCVVAASSAVMCGDENQAGVEQLKKPINSLDTFQQTLTYAGRVGDKLNFRYREFSGSIARPAFTDTIEYDLAESKRIGYRGAQIEVIEATNRSIKYKVISNFNLAKR